MAMKQPEVTSIEGISTNLAPTTIENTMLISGMGVCDMYKRNPSSSKTTFGTEVLKNISSLEIWL